MFSGYVFHDSTTQKTVRIGKASYLWAGLFGGFYVLFKGGRPKALEAFGWHLLCWLVLINFLFVSSVLSPREQLIGLLVGAPVLLTMLSLRMVRLIRTRYRRRGWGVRQQD